MKNRKEYFDLSMESLRILGRWAADCAERVLGIYEDVNQNDPRPGDAINEIRLFAGGGKRTAKLRVVALAAYAASRETEHPAASAAAQSASLAAATAYTHPLVDVQQTKHIVGPAAYAALACELKNNNPECGNSEVQWALDNVRKEICDIVMNMPNRNEGKSRIDQLMFYLDNGIRRKYANNV
jgi:hypothetical protein